MRERRQPTRDDRTRPRDPTGHQQAERFEQARARTRPAAPRSSATRGVRLVEEPDPAIGSRRGARAREVARAGGTRRLRRVPCRTACVGRDDHARAREPGPPAEVDVVGARGTSPDRSRRARGTGRRARASPRATRRRRRGRRRAVPGRPRRARSPRTGRRSGRSTCRPRGGPRDCRGRRASGPTMPAFDRYASSTSRRAASGSSTTSSWQKSRKTAPSTEARASLAAAAKPREARAPADEGAGEGAAATRSVGSSADPLSSTRTDRDG